MSDLDLPCIFEPADVPNALAQIARLGEVLKAEFDLVAARMSWLVIAESFIFSAFATAAAAYRPDHPLARVLRYLAWVLPFVGMSLAACVYVAIFAGLSAVRTLKCQRDQMMAGLTPRLRIDLISVSNWQERWGNVPALVIPPLLFLIWAGALTVWVW
ncbi:MAG TPA: hypothetical protein VH475_30190 [Tepidisphaeraceae bacterium]|jgi:hypothetical protein